MRKIIQSSDLRLEDIPRIDSDWDEISEFALSFDPELELGTSNIYSAGQMNFDEESTLIELRTSLFLLQRWWNNRAGGVDTEGQKKFSRLLELIIERLSDPI